MRTATVSIDGAECSVSEHDDFSVPEVLGGLRVNGRVIRVTLSEHGTRMRDIWVRSAKKTVNRSTGVETWNWNCIGFINANALDSAVAKDQWAIDAVKAFLGKFSEGD